MVLRKPSTSCLHLDIQRSPHETTICTVGAQVCILPIDGIVINLLVLHLALQRYPGLAETPTALAPLRASKIKGLSLVVEL